MCITGNHFLLATLLISVTVDMNVKSPAQGFFYAQNLYQLN
ncbi:hypothetical protein PFLA_a3567 [Pseudoalteromonas flavipulchra NCIMB 2033 = ATCC BAA-314]|nr:hypothetical protein [Pseudoalteromonas flavipulchra NCIMB 2033 = ATCC BAA-314]MBE0374688.1 hypothetical protein [Pseudoalteromonas flavipulchra NCIMB 2033 = ATCC BAA-314]